MGRRDEIMAEIAGLKQILTNTDYKCMKHADGALTDAEYEETRLHRQSLRDQINELEAELATLDEGEGKENAE